MRQLRPEERWAQACIQHALPNCTVEPHDDGSEPGMYDLKILYLDGSTGAVEVTAAADSERLGLWREVRKRDLIRQEPGLIGGWLIRVLRSARVRDLDRGSCANDSAGPARGRERCLGDEYLGFGRRLPVVIGDWLDSVYEAAASVEPS